MTNLVRIMLVFVGKASAANRLRPVAGRISAS
jgi:hypothetical protein